MKKLRRLVQQSLYLMSAIDRQIYGVPALRLTHTVFKSFVLSYKSRIKNKKAEYIDNMIGDFAVLREDLQTIGAEGILKASSKPHVKMSADGYKVEIFTILGKLEKGMDKWSGARSSSASNESPDSTEK